MIVGVVLAAAGVAVLSALLFNAAVYALPVVIGIWVLQQALAWHVGSIGAIALAIAAGALIYAAGHSVFETCASRKIRFTVAAIFAVPAIFAGYAFAAALLRIGLTSAFWLHALAGLGAFVVGGTTLYRLAGKR